MPAIGNYRQQATCKLLAQAIASDDCCQYIGRGYEERVIPRPGTHAALASILAIKEGITTWYDEGKTLGKIQCTIDFGDKHSHIGARGAQ
jgi:hypothetical protein